MVRIHYLHPEVLSMRGSFIAKQIEDDNKIYAHRRERALKIKALREAYNQRKRGESNGERTEPKTN